MHLAKPSSSSSTVGGATTHHDSDDEAGHDIYVAVEGELARYELAVLRTELLFRRVLTCIGMYMFLAAIGRKAKQEKLQTLLLRYLGHMSKIGAHLEFIPKGHFIQRPVVAVAKAEGIARALLTRIESEGSGSSCAALSGVFSIRWVCQKYGA